MNPHEQRDQLARIDAMLADAQARGDQMAWAQLSAQRAELIEAFGQPADEPKPEKKPGCIRSCIGGCLELSVFFPIILIRALVNRIFR
jgi:hypothetical protein